MEVVTKDSGVRQKFDTGAQRDGQDNKPRPDLIPLHKLDALQVEYGGASFGANRQLKGDLIVGVLPTEVWNPMRASQIGRHPDYRPDLIPEIVTNRLAHLYGRGARKYTDNNWKRGIPLSRIYASCLRHLIQWACGDRSEDHLAAVVWNATALMWTETEVHLGRLPVDLADKGPMERER